MFLVPVSRHSARTFDRVFDEAFERFFANGSVPASSARTPALDVVENDGTYTVSVEMPGVSKDDIKVAIDGRRVDVSAASKKEAETKDGERIVHRERSATRWSRSFTLPNELDQGASNAKLENGVLTLVLGKKRAPGATQLTIN